jgi:hypothetical protein
MIVAMIVGYMMRGIEPALIPCEVYERERRYNLGYDYKFA